MVKVVQSQNQEKLNREISVDLASQVPPKTFFVCSIDFLKPEGLLVQSRFCLWENTKSIQEEYRSLVRFDGRWVKKKERKLNLKMKDKQPKLNLAEK